MQFMTFSPQSILPIGEFKCRSKDLHKGNHCFVDDEMVDGRTDGRKEVGYRERQKHMHAKR